jgi:hypothetical protein
VTTPVDEGISHGDVLTAVIDSTLVGDPVALIEH